jgi:hypothetical protein
VWPKAILVLAMVACVYEIAKSLLFGRWGRDLPGVLGSVLKDVPMEAVPDEPGVASYPHLLWAGIAMTVLYVVVIEKLGFFLCTAIYLPRSCGLDATAARVIATSLIGASPSCSCS